MFSIVNAPGEGPLASEVTISAPNPAETAATDALDSLGAEIVSVVEPGDGGGVQVYVQMV